MHKAQNPTALDSLFYSHWNGIECIHSILAGIECSFHSDGNERVIPFPLEWIGHSIPAGMEYHSTPNLKKYAYLEF